MNPIFELSRPLPADRISAVGLAITVTASAMECAAIAQRLMVPSVEAVRCAWRLRTAPGGVIEAEGSLHAQLHQECVVSLDTFQSDVVEEFAVRFVPAGTENPETDDPDEPDEVPFEAGILDLGEATVEQLALALDPYPRKPGATPLIPSDGQASHPFDALAKRPRD